MRSTEDTEQVTAGVNSERFETTIPDFLDHP